MAIIAHTPDNTIQALETVTWTPVTGSDTCQAWIAPRAADKTVHVYGTFGDTLSIKGSNDGTNYVTLTDNLGLPLEFTAAGIKLIAEAPKYIQPSAGASITSVTIIITGTKD